MFRDKAELTNFESSRSAEDFEYVVQMTRWLLQPLGLWPRKFSTFPIFFRLVSIAACTYLFAFLLVPCCLQMFLVEKDLGVRLKMIGPLSFCLMNIIKYYGLLYKENEIGNCLSIIATDWYEIDSEERRKFMLENAKYARYVISICAIFMYGGGLPYITILPMTQAPMIIGNDSYRHLPYPSYFVIFNPHIRPIFDLVFVTHVFCGSTMFTTTVGICAITITCVVHITSQCSITCATLKSVAGSLDEKTYHTIVKQHLSSLKFASKLEIILNKLCLCELLGCTFNICMLGFYFLTEYENSEMIGLVTYFLLLISFIFNVFIFSYTGDLLTEKCQEIGQQAYGIKWYELSPKEARYLVLIIELTQRPVLLTAGKMVNLSIGSFCNVLKASATYLNMLRTLTSDI